MAAARTPRDDDQLSLFGPPARAPGVPTPSSAADAHVEPAAISDDERDLASRLPPELRLGTSSWSFPGWGSGAGGIVYRRLYETKALARDGLSAYAACPLFRTVGLDKSYYAPLPIDEYRRLAASVPEGFRFLVKAFDALTRPEIDPSTRTPSASFLDAELATDRVIGPSVNGLGRAAGPIVFQFSPMSRSELAALGGPTGFADRLHAFLSRLPMLDPARAMYAVELRTPALLTDRYVQALRDARAAHCLCVHPAMTDVLAQARAVAGSLDEFAASQPAVICRWMLHAGQTYQAASQRYSPFSAIVDDDPLTRGTLADICLAALRRARDAWVIVNNKAEGSAPLSVRELARTIASRRAKDA